MNTHTVIIDFMRIIYYLTILPWEVLFAGCFFLFCFLLIVLNDSFVAILLIHKLVNDTDLAFKQYMQELDIFQVHCQSSGRNGHDG